MELQLNPTEEKALSLLGDGHSQVDVANAIGVTESRISQLMADERFRAAVVERRYKNLQKTSERHTSINSAQDKILEKIHKVIPLVSKPMELVRMFEVLNKAADKSKVDAPAQQINQQVVVLNIPVKAVHKYVKNSRGQIVEVDGQPILTAPNTVLTQLEEDDNDRAQITAVDAVQAKSIERREKADSNERYQEGSVIRAEDL